MKNEGGGRRGLYQICKKVTQEFHSNTERDFLCLSVMVMLHLKSVQSSPLHCSHWTFVSGFHFPHCEIVLSFATLVCNNLNDECPAVCNRSVQKQRGIWAVWELS